MSRRRELSPVSRASRATRQTNSCSPRRNKRRRGAVHVHVALSQATRGVQPLDVSAFSPLGFFSSKSVIVKLPQTSLPSRLPTSTSVWINIRVFFWPTSVELPLTIQNYFSFGHFAPALCRSRRSICLVSAFLCYLRTLSIFWFLVSIGVNTKRVYLSFAAWDVARVCLENRTDGGSYERKYFENVLIVNQRVNMTNRTSLYLFDPRSTSSFYLYWKDIPPPWARTIAFFREIGPKTEPLMRIKKYKTTPLLILLMWRRPWVICLCLSVFSCKLYSYLSLHLVRMWSNLERWRNNVCIQLFDPFFGTASCCCCSSWVPCLFIRMSAVKYLFASLCMVNTLYFSTSTMSLRFCVMQMPYILVLSSLPSQRNGSAIRSVEIWTCEGELEWLDRFWSLTRNSFELRDVSSKTR